jgi:ribonuclease HII
MRRLDGEHPQYGFARHKGYGTREHMDALKAFGPCAIHRLSFAPVRAAVAQVRFDFGFAE